MSRDELEGVLGHEVAHIANGDMVTMTLIQGIINAFVMFFARVIAFAVTQAISSRSDDSSERGGSPFIQFAITFALEILFSFLGMIVVAWFSRYREYRADIGGARYAGRSNMVAALQKLQMAFGRTPEDERGGEAIAAFKISSGKRSRFMALLSTHPPLEERIARLRQQTV
jgi:heat shock protein HtpX